MLSIMRNDWYRMKEQRMYLFVALGLTICAVILAIVLTNKLEPKMNLAVTGQMPKTIEASQIQVTHLEKEPALSKLIQGRYDAVVHFDNHGSYTITTAKPNTFKEQLEAVLSGAENCQDQAERTRGTGANVVGYMLMFLLMQGVLYARLFAEDKEKHQIERIVSSPISFSKYLAGHVAFMWVLIFVPSVLVIMAVDLSGISLGFALWQYLFLIALIAFLSTSFAICLNSFFCGADTANMVGSCIIVLTSVLSGTFYDMGSGNSLLSKLLYALPQKNLMIFLNKWEQDALNGNSLAGLVYVIIIACLFLCIGIVKTRKDYIYRRSV